MIDWISEGNEDHCETMAGDVCSQQREDPTRTCISAVPLCVELYEADVVTWLDAVACGK